MENRPTHKIYEEAGNGEVMIADEVVAIIAGLAAMEVKGVSSMAGDITSELIAKLGMKNLSKGVTVEVIENTVTANLSLNLDYGVQVPEVCRKVQERVKAAVENMTGMTVIDVNIKVNAIELPNSDN